MDILLLILLLANTGLVIFLLITRQSKNDATGIKEAFAGIEKTQERTERIVREDIAKNREELGRSMNAFEESLSKQLLTLTQMNEQKLEKVRDVVDKNLKALQEDNSAKLEKMRETVDEKLHSTLERRLGESFQVVSDRLEKVHQGLGEMQNLATGVGDLKKVLTNVKTRGTWGEVQLGNLLDQILTADQYTKNVATKKGSRDHVEFAIKLPGREGEAVYIPIDAKFPKEDYERYLDAHEAGDVAAIEESSKAIEQRIKSEAKDIRDKYLDPPHTTDFGILYLPIEGLYAEVLRRPGLCETLQREYRVNVSGPTTITALLNSLQMGFRTLAVEKRASEVWTLLGAVKNEFGKFGDILQKTHQKLQLASKEIENAERKTRTIERKLKKVQEMPSSGPDKLQIESVDFDLSSEQVDDQSIV